MTLAQFFKKYFTREPRKHNWDPVCGMKASDGIVFEHNNKRFFFCSNHCKEQFIKDPGAYGAH